MLSESPTNLNLNFRLNDLKFNSIKNYFISLSLLKLLSEVFFPFCNGTPSMTPKVACKVFNHFHHKKQNINILTFREDQVANGIIDGMSYKMIADPA